MALAIRFFPAEVPICKDQGVAAVPSTCEELTVLSGHPPPSGHAGSLAIIRSDDLPTESGPLVLAVGARGPATDLGAGDLIRIIDGDDALAHSSMPLFAVLGYRTGSREVHLVTDALGFRQTYLARGEGWAAISTSAVDLGRMTGSGLDRAGLAVQSLLGWQLGDRTLFRNVSRVPARSRVVLDGGHGRLTTSPAPEPTKVTPSQAVREAASFLRSYVGAFLDDHPDAVLQLTGGQDSRLLLSAVPLARRRGLRTMTLDVGGGPDARIAAEISDRYGMAHQVITLDGVRDLSPEQAHVACLGAAKRLSCMADPIAFAVLQMAEEQVQQGPRLSGLGGEVARGFYYMPGQSDGPVSAARVNRLIAWRMFANESVAKQALLPEFLDWANELATSEIKRLLEATGLPWRAATDRFYLEQRMQRWAGVTDTAVCTERLIVNPMLHHRFLELAEGLAPEHKAGARFLAQLQVELDDELARLPLEGRPAPVTYATAGGSTGSGSRPVLPTSSWASCLNVFVGRAERQRGANPSREA